MSKASLQSAASSSLGNRKDCRGRCRVSPAVLVDETPEVREADEGCDGLLFNMPDTYR